ncbi:MAG: AhpC/TSA family protein [Tannerellaceae bacterium]|jgi:peroxiredoxin|nr:AhpC/TSA family protein [Tannerellaceae bacterium]
MKKLVSLLLCAGLFSACGEKGYVIEGTVSGADLNGMYVYLYEYGSAAATPIDSALVKNGTFLMEGLQETPLLSMLRFANDAVEAGQPETGENAPYSVLFVLENAQYKAELSETPALTGTPESDAFAAFQDELTHLWANIEQLADGMNSDNAEAVAKAEADYEEMYNSLLETVRKYIRNNPDAQTSAKLLYDFRYSLDENDRMEIIARAGDAFKAVPGIDKIIEHLAVLEKVAVGRKFTDFDMADPDGTMRKLSDHAGKGKYVLIDFWASWCPPCRADMPHLVELYGQYKAKDFEIVGISLDRTADAWKKGIKELNMTWPQLSDVKYWQCEGAAIYGVNSIPHTVLLAPDGTIIAKNLRGKELDTKLAELLNQN